MEIKQPSSFGVRDVCHIPYAVAIFTGRFHLENGELLQ